MGTKISRRDFLASSAAAGLFTIVPSYVLGQNGQTPPSEKLNIACIGVGGRGADDVQAVSTENFVAFCDVDDKRAAGIYNKFPNVKTYRDFRIMLEKEEKNIDAVVVATPDHIHAPAAIMAMKMGKHVYCEKPLSHSVYEARMMSRTARQMKVATQMGNHAHAWETLRVIVEVIRSGIIGNIREVHSWSNRPVWPQNINRPTDTFDPPAHLDWDLWLGPAPYRPYHPIYLPFNWRGWWDFGTGAIGDMACHIIDPAFWALQPGAPTSIESRVVGGNKETGPAASIVKFDFPAQSDKPGISFYWYDGGLKPFSPEELGLTRKMSGSATLYIGEKGKIMGDHGSAPRLLPETKMADFKKPPQTLPRAKNGHHQEWITACKGGPEALSNFDYAGKLTEMVLLGNIAIRTGERIIWDSENLEITNNPEANQLVKREYRPGWTL